MIPGLILLRGPGRDQIARELRDRHGAKLLGLRQYRPPHDHPALDRFAYLTACLRHSMSLPDPLVVWSGSLDEVIGTLPPRELAAVRRPVSRMLNRLGAVVATSEEVPLPAVAAAELVEKVEHNRARQLPEALERGVLNFGGHVGDAEFLLVGDRVNPRRPVPGWPFYGLGGSSQFLGEALDRLGIQEWRICVVDINDPRGPELVRKALLRNRLLRPVLLGREAEQGWARAGLDVDAALYVQQPLVRLNHPQWYRRFHAGTRQLDRDLAAALAPV